MDLKTLSGYFVGYYIGSRGSRFFCSSHIIRIVESDRAVYFEDDFGFDDSNGPREPQFREESVFIHCNTPNYTIVVYYMFRV